MTPTRTPAGTRLKRRLLREARIAPGALALSLGANALLGAAIVLQAVLLSRIIHRAYRLGEGLEDLSSPLLVLIAVVTGRAVLSFVSAAAAAELAIQVRGRLRQRLVAQLYALGPSFNRRERSGDIVLSVTEGIDKLDGYFREYLPGVFTAILLPILILLVVLPLDLLTFGVLLVTAPLIPLFMALIGRAAGGVARRQFLEMRQLGAHFLDVMQGLNTLKLVNRSHFQVETIGRISSEFREATMRVLRVAFLSALTLEMLATLSVAIIAVEIGVRLIYAGITFEQALFLLVIAPEFYLPLRALGAKFHLAAEGTAAADRLFELLDAPAVGPSERVNQAVPSLLNIRFEAVSLSYTNRTHPALADISFTVSAGQHVAIVGATGSGKSSIASMLLRFLEPDSGRISIDGCDLRHIPPVEWRKHVAWVSQSPYLFDSSIAENIRFGRPDAPMEWIISAARSACAHEFITQMPDGYDTRCGERGLRLSGGQAQRIAIARAFLLDAPILILDEPTSQLDPASEADFMSGLRGAAANKTVLLITHRLNTAVSFDSILVLDQGRIVEQGTHSELLQAHGYYWRLVEGGGGSSDAP